MTTRETETGGFRHVLVAVDFSPTAEDALQWAAALAKGGDTAVTLLHAIHGRPKGAPSREVEAELERRLKTLAATLEAADIPVVTRQLPGKPWDVVTDCAAKLEADLVVLGSVGSSTYSRLSLGRTADRIIRAAAPPVLTIRKGGGGPAVLKRPIIVGIDFSEESAHAARVAARIAYAINGGGRLVLLHAIDFAVEYGFAAGAEVVAEARAEEEGRARRELETLAETLRTDDVDVDVVVRPAYAATALEEEARAVQAGLVALGTHGRTGLSHFMLGSIAERVLHHASCAVLTVHAG